jgi:hypothetical protein
MIQWRSCGLEGWGILFRFPTDAADVLFSKISRPALGFTKPPIRYFPRVCQGLLRPNVKTQSIKLSTYLYLAPILRMGRAAPSLRHCPNDVQRNNVNIAFIWPITVGGQTLRSGIHWFIDLIGNNEKLLQHLRKGYYFTYLQQKAGKWSV